MKKYILMIVAFLAVHGCCARFVVTNKSDKFIQLCGVMHSQEEYGKKVWDIWVHHCAPNDSIELDTSRIDHIQVSDFKSIDPQQFEKYRTLKTNFRPCNIGTINNTISYRFYHQYDDLYNKAKDCLFAYDLTYNNSINNFVFNGPGTRKELSEVIEKFELAKKIKEYAAPLSDVQGINTIIAEYAHGQIKNKHEHNCCIL